MSFCSPKEVFTASQPVITKKYQLYDKPVPVSRLPVESPTPIKSVAASKLPTKVDGRPSVIRKQSIKGYTSKTDSSRLPSVSRLASTSAISKIPTPSTPSYRLTSASPRVALARSQSPPSPQLPVLCPSALFSRSSSSSSSPSLHSAPSLTSRQSSSSLSAPSLTSCNSESSLSAPSLASCPSTASSTPFYPSHHAPYLVVSDNPSVTLKWEADPESNLSDVDPAEEVWKRIESRMGRRLRCPSLKERGRWVVKAVRMADRSTSISSMDEVEEMDERNDTDGLRPPNLEGTALFDMSGPLIRGSGGVTPQNTPLISRDSLQRNRRVRKRDMPDSPPVEVGNSLSNPTALVDSKHLVSTSPPNMYRLDSHIVTALQTLQEIDTPALDQILNLSPLIDEIDSMMRPTRPPLEMGGLGLGMHLRMDSVYSLKAKHDDDEEAAYYPDDLLEVIKIKDLDTGESWAIGET
ncbi:hypothetical protein P7C73_g5066, partial [Tremellales sp. Uapishka_1]